MNYPPWTAGRCLLVPGILVSAAIRCSNISQRNGFGVETEGERTSAVGMGCMRDREIPYVCRHAAYWKNTCVVTAYRYAGLVWANKIK